ncbi:MAG: adenylate/guanylate cyclase domain-containing protein [Planctomycetota bacterium]|nr:adenylate/guanylate cyclase domain-containing protein [Planctomycetota bacterium]
MKAADSVPQLADSVGAADSPAASPQRSQLVVFMFTDLVGSSALARQLGDADYVRCVLEPHNAIFRRLRAEYSGAKEIKHTGDGFMATFASASDAAECSLRFHHALRLAKWVRVEPQSTVGIHLGEAIEFDARSEGDRDLAGDAANMTARVMSLAQPGQTLLTRVAFDSARQSGRVRAHWLEAGADASPPEVQWLNHGRYRFKGSVGCPVPRTWPSGWRPCPSAARRSTRSGALSVKPGD